MKSQDIIRNNPKKRHIFIGRNDFGDAIYWHLDNEANRNLIILGASGSGKTEAIKVVSYDLVKARARVCIIDFHGDIVGQKINTVSFSTNPDEEFGFNPLDVCDRAGASISFFDHSETLLECLRRAKPKLGHLQEDVLRDAFKKIYEDRGWIKEGQMIPNGSAPVFSDVLKCLQKLLEEEDRAHQYRSIKSCIALIKGLFGQGSK